MKGVHLTELIEFAEKRFSLQTADAMLSPPGLPSGGVYTQVGSYHHQELIELVKRLSRLTHVPAPQLFREFGQYLYSRLAALYPRLCSPHANSLDLLAHVHTHIHHEVHKLYPDADPPSLKAERIDADHLILHYDSVRGFADLAEGLICGCVQHYGETVDIRREDDPHARGTRTCFRLTRHPIQ
jgi:hypothetical protein